MSIRSILCVLVALGAFFAPPAVASSKEPLYVRYEKMSDAQKAKLIRKYVKKRGKFYVVSVSKYKVYTNISAEYALSTAILMDEFYNKFTSVFKGRFSKPGRPKLYVYRTKDEYLSSPRKPASWSAGWYSSGNTTLYVYDREGVQSTLFHEGTHQLMHAYLGSFSGTPVWFSEGCATNFQTWELEYSGGENRKLSPLASHYRGVMVKQAPKGSIYSVEKLFGLSHEAWLNSSGDDVTVNYATAWSLVNYLLSSKKNIGIFNKILLGIKKQRSTNQILSSRDKQKLQQAWYDDIKTRLSFYDTYIAPYIHPNGGLYENVEPAQVLANFEKATDAMKQLPSYRFYRGYLFGWVGMLKPAIHELLAVEKEESEYPRLFELIGRAYLRIENYKMAEKYFKIALKVRPGDEEITALKKEAYDKMRAAKNR